MTFKQIKIEENIPMKTKLNKSGEKLQLNEEQATTLLNNVINIINQNSTNLKDILINADNEQITLYELITKFNRLTDFSIKYGNLLNVLTTKLNDEGFNQVMKEGTILALEPSGSLLNTLVRRTKTIKDVEMYLTYCINAITKSCKVIRTVKELQSYIITLNPNENQDMYKQVSANILLSANHILGAYLDAMLPRFSIEEVLPIFYRLIKPIAKNRVFRKTCTGINALSLSYNSLRTLKDLDIVLGINGDINIIQMNYSNNQFYTNDKTNIDNYKKFLDELYDYTIVMSDLSYLVKLFTVTGVEYKECDNINSLYNMSNFVLDDLSCFKKVQLVLSCFKSQKLKLGAKMLNVQVKTPECRFTMKQLNDIYKEYDLVIAETIKYKHEVRLPSNFIKDINKGNIAFSELTSEPYSYIIYALTRKEIREKLSANILMYMVKYFTDDFSFTYKIDLIFILLEKLSKANEVGEPLTIKVKDIVKELRSCKTPLYTNFNVRKHSTAYDNFVKENKNNDTKFDFKSLSEAELLLCVFDDRIWKLYREGKTTGNCRYLELIKELNIVNLIVQDKSLQPKLTKRQISLTINKLKKL